MKRTILALSIALLACTQAALAAPSVINGTFALQGGLAKTSAHLSAAQFGNDTLDWRLQLYLTPLGSNRPIRSYDLDMTKSIHMIIVSDDFRTFLHVHPALRADGTFTIDQHFPRATTYHVYADVTPHAIGQQVFRFEFSLGAGATEEPADASGTTVAAGPYEVTISTDTFKAGVPTPLVVHISENGMKASGLHPYLGALAHAVFLNESNLSYLHVHPMALSARGDDMGMDMDMAMPTPDPKANSSPDMRLRVALATPGTYRFWLQFRGADSVYAAPFVVTAR